MVKIQNKGSVNFNFTISKEDLVKIKEENILFTEIANVLNEDNKEK